MICRSFRQLRAPMTSIAALFFALALGWRINNRSPEDLVDRNMALFENPWDSIKTGVSGSKGVEIASCGIDSYSVVSDALLKNDIDFLAVSSIGFRFEVAEEDAIRATNVLQAIDSSDIYVGTAPRMPMSESCVVIAVALESTALEIKEEFLKKEIACSVAFAGGNIFKVSIPEENAKEAIGILRMLDEPGVVINEKYIFK